MMHAAPAMSPFPLLPPSLRQPGFVRAAMLGSMALHVLILAWIISNNQSQPSLPEYAIEVSVLPASLSENPPEKLLTKTPEKAPQKPAAQKTHTPAPKLLPLAPSAELASSAPTASTAQEKPTAEGAPQPAAAAPASSHVLSKPQFDAAYIRNPAPDYPTPAKRRGMQGTVMLDVLVSASGEALQVGVAQSSGFDMLDNAAKQAVQRWKFVPARLGSQAVEASVIVPIEFRLDS